MVTEVRHLKMAELSARSGVPATTIRHYLRLGLLGEPLRVDCTSHCSAPSAPRYRVAIWR